MLLPFPGAPLLQQGLLLLLLLQQLLPLLLRCGVSGCLCDNSLSLSLSLW